MGYSHGTALIKMGLSNREQEDFAAIQQSDIRDRQQRAFCTSLKCSQKGRQVWKSYATRNSDECPDCGHALIWKE